MAQPRLMSRYGPAVYSRPSHRYNEQSPMDVRQQSQSPFEDLGIRVITYEATAAGNKISAAARESSRTLQSDSKEELNEGGLTETQDPELKRPCQASMEVVLHRRTISEVK